MMENFLEKMWIWNATIGTGCVLTFRSYFQGLFLIPHLYLCPDLGNIWQRGWLNVSILRIFKLPQIKVFKYSHYLICICVLIWIIFDKEVGWIFIKIMTIFKYTIPNINCQIFKYLNYFIRININECLRIYYGF